MPAGTQRGTGFIGLQQYLNANRQAATSMGNRLADTVEQQGAAAQSAIDKAKQEAEGQIEAATPVYMAPKVSPGMDSAEVRAAYDNTPTAEQLAYGGPKDLAGADALQTQATEAAQAARLAGTDAGAAVIMGRNATPSAGYGVGAHTLDAFLARRGGGERLGAAASKFGELQKYLGTAQQGVKDKAAGAEKRAGEVAAQYEALRAGGPQGMAPAGGQPQKAPQPSGPGADRNRWLGGPVGPRRYGHLG